ncbi:orotidine-5'-phosphate decarboxylase [Scopulibacillus cellulosilyticus]|uniref:Orotidine 5'-phosphate decarboxylase n=1 Tax=Scopulibacillus cellulosilyticus TaxID=2665665 RepID=A0ABW2PSW1_9BACL
MSGDVIIALDVANKQELSSLLTKIDRKHLYVKVGMELFYQEGPELVKDLKHLGYQIFLDLKLHDIPTTVYKAMKGLAKLNVDMVNVHAAGGQKMMKAALAGLEEGTPSGAKRPLCIAVTQLTSTDQQILENDILIHQPLDQVILTYGRKTYEAGLDGVVCSPLEAGKVKEHVSQDFLTVTPGIRLSGDSADDQKRVTTPKKARTLGSDYIVVGRSITGAPEPGAAYDRVLKEWRNES